MKKDLHKFLNIVNLVKNKKYKKEFRVNIFLHKILFISQIVMSTYKRKIQRNIW